MPGETQVNTLEVAVSANGQVALKTLDQLADKCEEIGKSLDKVVTKGKGLSTIGSGTSKNAGDLQKQIIKDYETAKKYREEEAAIRKKTAAIWEHVRALREKIAADQREIDSINDVIARNERFNNIMGLISGTLRTVVTAFSRFTSIMIRAGSGAIKFAKALTHPIASLKELLGLNRRTGSGFLGGLLGNKSLAKYVGLIALRRAVTGAIRAIVSGIKEGFENIRNYSSAINSEMNSIENSLLYVKNAWAAAFAPIVSVVRPYINYLLDAIASALNAIGRLVAMLTGKGFAVQAVKLSDAMYEAGKAGKSAASGTGKATKAAEEYKKTIMGFDQLHVLNDQDSSGSSGGSGGGGGGGSNSGVDVSNMFTTVSLAGQLKDAINAENWDEVGKLLAEKVNSAFSKLDQLISWENVGEKITKTVTAITTTLNSLVDNINWNLIGRTIGSGINTLVNTWNLFFDKFDFVNLGKKISEGVNGLFNRVNWTELGRAVTQKFKALWDTLYGFVTNLDWAKIGKSIGEFINGAMKNINLGTVGSTIAETLNGIATSLNNFTSTVDWDEFSSQISSFFTNFFTKFRAADFIDSLATFAGKLVKGLTVALSNPNTLAAIEDFARQIGQKLATLEWAKYLVQLAGAILVGLGTAMDALLQGFVEELLVKAGLTKEEAHNAFANKQNFEAYALTGDKNFLPQPEDASVDVTANVTNIEDKAPVNQHQIKNNTAVETKVRDEIAPNQKNVNNSTAVLTSTKDGVPAAKKAIPNFRADLSLFKDGILQKNKNLNNYNALVTGNTDKINNKNKNLNGFTANANNFYDGVSINKKNVGVKANATSFHNNLGYTPSINVVARITKLNMVGGLVGQAITGKANGGIFSGGSWKPITRYASGGTPQSAELFMARESGPELVGRIGSKTAVMNNNQIVSSVAAGVRQAVAEGMAIARGGEGGASPYEIHVTVKTQNDEVLARAVDRGYAKRKYRLGTAMG